MSFPEDTFTVESNLKKVFWINFHFFLENGMIILMDRLHSASSKLEQP